MEDFKLLIVYLNGIIFVLFVCTQQICISLYRNSPQGQKEIEKYEEALREYEIYEKERKTPKEVWNEKKQIFKDITKEANKGKFLLIKNVIKVVLMSLVWAYGFFKLANFN